jgi:uncharacterized membrane protein YfcA
VTALLLVLLGTAAGTLGGLLGVGGGVVVIPALSLGFGVPFRSAVAVSLVVIIASASATSAEFVQKGTADMRVGVVLELATVGGGIAGSAVAGLLPESALKLLFSAVAVASAAMLWRRRRAALEEAVSGRRPVRGWGAGLAVSGLAGAFSGLIGVGGGVFKVPVMTLAMDLPFKVAAATSSFMIGVTAAASAYLYAARGELDVRLAAPVVVGVFAGSRIGTALLARLPARRLQGAFAALLLAMGVQMLWDVVGAAR